MSTPVDGGELSISQHLRTAKRKLQGPTFGGRFVWARRRIITELLTLDLIGS